MQSLTSKSAFQICPSKVAEAGEDRQYDPKMQSVTSVTCNARQEAMAARQGTP